jgi:hypothetical protein
MLDRMTSYLHRSAAIIVFCFLGLGIIRLSAETLEIGRAAKPNTPEVLSETPAPSLPVAKVETSEEKKPESVTAKSSYRLRPRDFIRVGVINEGDTVIDRRINPDGTIDVPFLKQLCLCLA